MRILSISVNIANPMQPGAAKNLCLDEMAATYKQDDLDSLGLTAGVIESTMVVADLQVMEVLSVIRPES